MVGALLALAIATSAATTAAAADAPYCPPGQAPTFDVLFQPLRVPLGSEMGNPLECAHRDPTSGDVVQQTTTGLAYYRASVNVVAFTDGSHHWAQVAQNIVQWDGDSLDPPGVTLPVAPPSSGEIGAPTTPIVPPTVTPVPEGFAALQDRWDKNPDSIWKPGAFIVILSTMIVWFLSVRVGQEGHRGAPQ